MQILGQNLVDVRRKLPHKPIPPLIGFSPEPLITYPDAPFRESADTPANLDANHPYFVLVHHTHDWGGEVNCMFSFVGMLSKSLPSLSVVANGGPTTLREAVKSVEQSRKIIVLRGSTRAAVAIDAAVHGKSAEQLAALLQEVGLYKPTEDPLKLQTMLRQLEQIAAYKASNYERVKCFDLKDPPARFKSLLKEELEVERARLLHQ
jgi:hypothetical protein